MGHVLLSLALLATAAGRPDAPAFGLRPSPAKPAPPQDRVVKMTARRFTYSPDTIEVEQGVFLAYTRQLPEPLHAPS